MAVNHGATIASTSQVEVVGIVATTTDPVSEKKQQTESKSIVPAKQKTTSGGAAAIIGGAISSPNTGTKTEAVELKQSDPVIAALSATCAPEADVVKPGIPVTYTATVTGGIEPYTFSWSEPSNTHVYPTALDMQSLRVRYKGSPETRTETESLTVVSADEQSATANCGVTVSAVAVEKSAYSDSACLAQKQSYLPEVDAAYLSWFDQWQAARTQLDPCYSSNPIPYCDKQMGDLNVEWQEKISATMKSYQNKLTQCAPDQRKFGDVPDMVPSSY